MGFTTDKDDPCDRDEHEDCDSFVDDDCTIAPVSDLLQPGQSCFARFVGEFPNSKEAFAAMTEPGDVALVSHDGKPTWAYVKCALCGDIDFLPLVQYREGGNPEWRFTAREPVNIEPSIKSEAGALRLCHYFIHAGRFDALTVFRVARPSTET